MCCNSTVIVLVTQLYYILLCYSSAPHSSNYCLIPFMIVLPVSQYMYFIQLLLYSIILHFLQHFTSTKRYQMFFQISIAVVYHLFCYDRYIASHGSYIIVIVACNILGCSCPCFSSCTYVTPLNFQLLVYAFSIFHSTYI